MDDNQPTLGFLLHDVARLLRKRFEQNARGSGLTRSQWQTLALLSKNEGINQAGLADLMDVEPITLARILDRLQHLKLIERLHDANDRRVWNLRVTPLAMQKLQRAKKIGEATRAEALEGLSATQRQQLVDALQVIKSNLQLACEAPSLAGNRAEKRASNG